MILPALESRKLARSNRLGQRQENLTPVDKLVWRGYCYSRLGGRTNYNLAKDAYLELLSGNFDGYDIPDVTCFFLAIVYFHLGQYSDTEEMTLLCEQHSELKSRILLHLAQKTKDKTKLAKNRLELSDSKDAVLSKRHLGSPINLLFRGYAYYVVIYNKLQLNKF